MHETYVEIDIDNIIYNINSIKKLNDNSYFCAVVKANGYGLGSTEIGKEIEEYVDYFAVARLNEAIVLRRVGIKKPILVLGFIPHDEISKCIEYDIDIIIYSLSYAKLINSSIKGKVKAHLAIDTGHSRLGFRMHEMESIKELKELNNIEIIAAFTHFSTADEEDETFTNIQKKKFDNMLSFLKDNFDIKFTHISNSAGAINHNITKDMMRIGISMYGIYPSDYMKFNPKIDLKKSFEIKSLISFVKEVDKGTPISYGRTYITDKKMKIATIPIGYADGFERAFSNIGEVMINGKLSRVLGRVCMDQIMVDVTGIDVDIEDEVIIYPDIYEEARKIDTIVYELMTSISIRVPRIYKKKGKIISVDDYLGEIYEN